MKVIVVGGGGREHALAWKLGQSPEVDEVICAPGNAGTASLGRNEPVGAEDIEGQLALAKREKPGLVVIGPEAPLAMGLADRLEEIGIPAFGPKKAAARIEASKAFSKELMEEAGIPIVGTVLNFAGDEECAQLRHEEYGSDDAAKKWFQRSKKV